MNYLQRLFLIFFVNVATISDNVLCQHRGISKRFLIFPRAGVTRYQFIAGIGVPLPLETQSVISGVVFKVLYLLPYNASMLHPLSIFPTYVQPLNSKRRKRNDISYEEEAQLIEQGRETEPNDIDRYKYFRWSIYEGIEKLLDKYGYPGRECLLKSICENAQLPLSDDQNLLGQLIHILITPSSSDDPVSACHQKYYRRAEIYGSDGGNCDTKYSSCPASFLNLISFIQ